MIQNKHVRIDFPIIIDVSCMHIFFSKWRHNHPSNLCACMFTLYVQYIYIIVSTSQLRSLLERMHIDRCMLSVYRYTACSFIIITKQLGSNVINLIVSYAITISTRSYTHVHIHNSKLNFNIVMFRWSIIVTVLLKIYNQTPQYYALTEFQICIYHFVAL
jgi:Ca2+/Na+ antiporter